MSAPSTPVIMKDTADAMTVTMRLPLFSRAFMKLTNYSGSGDEGGGGVWGVLVSVRM